jgi:putative ABC transport system ATP-binding protein
VAAAELVAAHALGRRGLTGEWLLRGISFGLAAGERLALTGPSGSGKTLLLRSLALLDPTEEGEVHWQGRAVADAEVPAFRRRAIYLHQRPVLVEGTVADNLRLPFTFGGGGELPRARALAWLESLGRQERFLDRTARDLSGGEAQLVALLRALLVDPAVLLLDEPTASLDPATASQLEGLVAAWLEEPGERGLLWVTHDLEQAARVATRRLRLEAGSLQPEAASR